MLCLGLIGSLCAPLQRFLLIRLDFGIRVLPLQNCSVRSEHIFGAFGFGIHHVSTFVIDDYYAKLQYFVTLVTYAVIGLVWLYFFLLWEWDVYSICSKNLCQL